MSTKHVRTVGDLVRFNLVLNIECWTAACGHERQLSGMEAVQLLGNVPIAGLSKWFRCSKCGFKQSRVWWGD